jgi:hypothetical protein
VRDALDVLKRLYPDETIQAAILSAAGDFEQRIRDAMGRYRDAIAGAIPTKRINREIMA